MSENVVLGDLHEAVVYLVHIEMALKASRSLYYQIQHLGTTLSEWRAEETLGELEMAGRELNRLKEKVLLAVELSSFPIEVDRV
jgi:hypothetical protein